MVVAVTTTLVKVAFNDGRVYAVKVKGVPATFKTL